MQTPTADKRKDAIYDDYDKKKQQFNKAKKKNKKKKKANSTAAQPHASSLKDLEGVLAKDAYYAQNCHDYLDTKDPGRKAVFENIDTTKAHQLLKWKNKAAYDRFRFDKYPENFCPNAPSKKKNKKGKKTKAGQRYPYVWEAHHMLPGSAFYYEIPGKGQAFEPWMIRLILQSKYNINHGHNMIPLPDLARPGVPIHQVPQHPGDHPEWTQKVIVDLRRVAQQLEAEKNKGDKHPELKTSVFEKLKALEDKAWRFLTALGKSLVDAAIQGQKVKADVVAYGTKDNPKKFEFGALY